MEYTVQQLAKLAGISPRAVRYYDEIGILKPARISPSGYRIYGQNEVDILQQIMFYRELGMHLDEIHKILTSPGFNRTDALKEHRRRLLEKRKQLDNLISNVDRSIAASEGRITMKDNEKFEGFKKRALEENEQKYGKEARERYGAEAVERSNQKWLNMSEEQYGKYTALEEEFINTLLEAYKTGDPAGETAQKAADLHRQWLCYTWPVYSKEAHAGLARMYVEDERFKAYYDKYQPGLAEFLKDAVIAYTEK